MAFKTRSNGKLLLTGEYLVLEGALSVAIPLRMGQSMKVTEASGAELHWITKDHHGEKWFECKLNLIDFSIEKTTDKEKASFIQGLIQSAARLNSDFLSQWKKYKVTCLLEFDPEWGWGSSSTLITNIAHWAELSPFELFFDTQSGSGYDIAAAISSGTIFYQKNENELSFEGFDMNTSLLENAYVFYQGRKSSSADAISDWKNQKRWGIKDIEQVSQISESIAGGSDLSDTMKLLQEHEDILSRILDLSPLQHHHPKYEGVMKSLGAWGGDFALALHADAQYTEGYLKEIEVQPYFRLADIALTG